MLKSTLEQWRMFIAVVESGGFNQASLIVHKSQSSIHHAVQKLEQSLGVVLFETQGRRVVLTSAGEVMLRRAQFLLDEAEKLEQVASVLSEDSDTQLRIAVDEIFPPSLLYLVLDKTSTQFPYLRVQLMESVLSGANDLLKNGDVDLSISGFPISDGFSEDLCEIEFIAVAHPEHPLHDNNQALSFQALKQHRQIVVRDSARAQGKDHGWLGSEQRWTVSHIRTSVDMISKGFGFAWLPFVIIQPYIEAGQLKPLNLERGAIRKVQLHLNFDDADKLGPAARDFIGELRFHIMNMPTMTSLESQDADSQ